MKKNTRALLSRTWPLGLALAAVFILIGKSAALAASAQEIDSNVTAALQTLYANTPGAQDLGDKARGILVFPNIVKGGFLFAAQYGDGALRKEGRTVGYYRSLAGSFGFQAGIQSFGYILFFMDDASLQYLNKSRNRDAVPSHNFRWAGPSKGAFYYENKTSTSPDAGPRPRRLRPLCACG